MRFTILEIGSCIVSIFRASVTPTLPRVCTKFEPLYQEVLAVVDVLENGPHGPREMSNEQHSSVVQKISDKIGSDRRERSGKLGQMDVH
jgi:hypothetical protein